VTATFQDVELGVDKDLDALLDWSHVPPCEAREDDGTGCDNPAEYICSVSCCNGQILLCEDCMFKIFEDLRQHVGWTYKCGFGPHRFIAHTNHLKVIDRLT